MKRVFLGIGVLFFLAGCKSTAEGYLKKDSASFKLNIESTPCFGTCPVYTMSIDETSEVSYNGKRFVPVEGVVSKTIPQWEVDSLKQVLLSNNFFELDTLYDANVTDVPSFILDFEAGNSDYNHKVTGRFDYPEKFSKIKAFLERLRKRNFSAK